MNETPDEMDLKISIKQMPGTEDLPLPAYETTGSSGMDLRAAVTGPITLKPGEIHLIPTGIAVAIPHGFEGQVRPRSGLALKHGIGFVNAPGTIDSDYRGEIGLIVINLGAEPFTIQRGDRVAQMVINRIYQAEIEVLAELVETDRGAGGFGHSGIN
jgi:dUTP pyrophosphatase